jgi:spore coat polysaccharide biosynthesis protein SpsF (cytidylyltransferase family)
VAGHDPTRSIAKFLTGGRRQRPPLANLSSPSFAGSNHDLLGRILAVLNTLGVIEVRGEGGTDWRISRKLGGKSILEWVVRRATDCQRLDAVVVLCGRRMEEAVRQLVPPDVKVLSLANRDPLATTAAALEQVRARQIVHICADNPFNDPVLIDRLVSTADAHPGCDYIGYCRGDGRPAILTHLGVFAEWCSGEALRRADREARNPAERRHVTTYLYGHPELFNVRLVPLPAELDREDMRLTIDGEEDWEHAQAIYEALASEEWDWQRIADLLAGQPAMRKRMALLNRAKSRV